MVTKKEYLYNLKQKREIIDIIEQREMLLGEDVELILDAKGVFEKEISSACSLIARGHLYEQQNPYNEFLFFDKLSYKIYGKDEGKYKEVELEDVLVNRNYIVCIGKPKRAKNNLKEE